MPTQLFEGVSPSDNLLLIGAYAAASRLAAQWQKRGTRYPSRRHEVAVEDAGADLIMGRVTTQVIDFGAEVSL